MYLKPIKLLKLILPYPSNQAIFCRAFFQNTRLRPMLRHFRQVASYHITNHSKAQHLRVLSLQMFLLELPHFSRPLFKWSPKRSDIFQQDTKHKYKSLFWLMRQFTFVYHPILNISQHVSSLQLQIKPKFAQTAKSLPKD